MIDVDLDDITSPPGRPGGSSTFGPAGPATDSAWRTASAPRTEPFFYLGLTAGSEWWDRSAPTSLRTTPYQTLFITTLEDRK